MAVSSNAQVLCGQSAINWDEFICAVFSAESIGLLYIYNLKDTNFVTAIEQARTIQGTQHSLLTLLFRHRHCLASDARDKVFALCGLCTDTSSNSVYLKPDYHMDTKILYVDLAIAALNRNGNLDVLGTCFASEKPSGLGLPSWAPD
jgi:hypothetical protein